MNGAPKCIRSCPAHPGRGTRYRLQPLVHPNTLRNKSLLVTRKPYAHRSSHKSYPKARHPRLHSASLSCTPTMRSASNPRRHRRHDAATLPYTKDTGPDTSTDCELCGRPDQRNASPRRPRTTYESPTAGMSHPQTGSKQQSHRQHGTAYTACPRQSPNITLSCRNAATNPQALQQSPTAHAYSPPTGPYVPNRTTPARGTLTVCTDSESLRTGLVPGQPGLVRPPAPQDHYPEGDASRPRAPTPKSAQRDTPQTNPLNYEQRELPTTRSRLPSSPKPS